VHHIFCASLPSVLQSFYDPFAFSLYALPGSPC